MLEDGDGIDFVLQLGEGEVDRDTTMWIMMGASIIFCIFVLNLFIAVHGAAYQEAQSVVKESFYCSRAKICLLSLMQPAWKRDNPRYMALSYLCLMCLAVPSWAIFVLHVPLHPLFGSMCLLSCFHLGDRWLLRRSWKYVKAQDVHTDRKVATEMQHAVTVCELDSSGTPPDLFLWWCEWDADAERTDTASSTERVEQIKTTLAESTERDRDQMRKSLTQVLSQVGDISDRLTKLESTLERQRTQNMELHDAVMKTASIPLLVSKSNGFSRWGSEQSALSQHPQAPEPPAHVTDMVIIPDGLPELLS